MPGPSGTSVQDARMLRISGCRGSRRQPRPSSTACAQATNSRAAESSLEVAQQLAGHCAGVDGEVKGNRWRSRVDGLFHDA